MNRKELTKTFMKISNLKKTLASMVDTKIFSHCQGKTDLSATILQCKAKRQYVSAYFYKLADTAFWLC